MAHGARVDPATSAEEAAREAGIDSTDGVTLTQVDKRRTELWVASVVVVVLLVVGVATLALGSQNLPEALRGGTIAWILAVLIVGLALAFLVYVFEKERSLRRLARALVEERVRALEWEAAYHSEQQNVKRLEELDRLKDDFVATVSHELRSPLTAIIGAAKTVSRKGTDMDAQHQAIFVGIIQRQADRLMRLVEEVLASSSLESGRAQTRRERVSLRPLVEGVIADLSHIQEGAEDRLILRTDPREPNVWGDPIALEQILSNLAENALKYSTQAVEIDVREAEQEVMLVVTDRGQGIPDDQLPNIFERYRRADAAKGGKKVGFGFGLFIVRSLVESHNGTIEVASEVGRGSSFTVHLPKRAGDRLNG